jgi:hypothetical protein
MIVMPALHWFSPSHRQAGPSSAWRTNQPIRKLCVTISSQLSAAPGLPYRAIAARASSAPSARSSSV